MIPARPTTRRAAMAKIISLSREYTDNSRLFGVKRVLMHCMSFPLYLLLAVSLPLAIFGGAIIYFAFRLIYFLTGNYPFSLTLRLGEESH